jgi:hypothetical protein
MQAALQTVSNSKLVGPRRHAQSGAPRRWHVRIGRLSQAASMGWYRFLSITQRRQLDESSSIYR